MFDNGVLIPCDRVVPSCLDAGERSATSSRVPVLII